jgi:uncharacterized protein Yka (UPF0111/DUF47 family)
VESRQLADLLLRCVEVLQSAVSCLRSSRELDKVSDFCRDIHQLENESDTVYQSALGKLFNTPDVDPIHVIKWKEIYERLEMAVDKCEDVSNTIEAIQLKYA